MKTIQKIGLGVGALALGVGAAVGITNAAELTGGTTSSASSTSTTSSGSDRQMPPGASGDATSGTAPEGQPQGGAPGNMAAELATALGVDEATIQEALDAAFSSQAAPTEGTRPDRSAMESTLVSAIVEKTGLDEATVQSALESVRPQGGPGGKGGPAGDTASGSDATSDGTNA